MQKDIYIMALEYAQGRESFSFFELCEHLQPSGIQREQLKLQIHNKQLFGQSSSDFFNLAETSNIPIHFTVEDKFRLLEYVSLEEARSSAKLATYFAAAAFIVSIVSLFLPIYVQNGTDRDNDARHAELRERLEESNEQIKEINSHLQTSIEIEQSQSAKADDSLRMGADQLAAIMSLVKKMPENGQIPDGKEESGSSK